MANQEVPQMVDGTTSSPTDWAWIRRTRMQVSPTVWLGIIAFVAFLLVIWLFPQQDGTQLHPLLRSDTWFPIVMGLLGSSIFLLYNHMRPTAEEDAARSHPVIRLFLGPIAGWLAHNMVSDKLAPQQIIWLAFLAGFSSDLLAGIINQMIRAIKLTLGIDRIPPSPPPPQESAAHTSAVNPTGASNA